MGTYSTLRSFFPMELTVKRNGFWRPTYELTDEQYSYGTLRHEGVWRPKAWIETADKTWVVSGKGWRSADIKSADGELWAATSANVWNTRITFVANDGFTATFLKPSVWKSTTVWESADGMQLLSIKARAFKTPVIIFDVPPNQNRWLLLLAFLALEIHLRRQKHAAAAAVT